MLETAISFLQRFFDCVERIAGLIFDAFRHRHGFVIIARGARDKYPAPGRRVLHDGAAIAGGCFKR